MQGMFSHGLENFVYILFFLVFSYLDEFGIFIRIFIVLQLNVTRSAQFITAR